MEAWKPRSLILTSRLKVRDRVQKLLFERHEEYFPGTSVPLLYRPKDTRRQNIMVTIPGPLLDGRPDQQELVLNDVVEVPLKYAREVLGGKWARAGLLTMPSQSTQAKGVTIADPKKIWIIDGSMVKSCLPGRIKGGVSQPARAGGMPPEEGSGEALT
ncbi:MAG: hypothetical protein AB2556_25075, partial [Candidatus Thiodiazotropha sp.]